MKYKTHSSICLSTQVGCRMGCVFCASTKLGLKRNLNASEIISTIYLVEKDIGRNISNLVFMGIGEPLDNYDNIIRTVKILNEKNGRNMSMRNITLSTCGIVPKIKKLADEQIPINITISLHNPFDEERKMIMPISNKYSVKELVDASKYYFEKTKRRISFEYTLIKGQNDSNRHIDELQKIFKDFPVHINLISLNSIGEYDGVSPSDIHIEEFKKELLKRGINTTIRRRQGADINGACGQLRLSQIEKKA